VTNNGKDWSYGVGLHFGWYGEVTDQLALGLSYRTKVWMTTSTTTAACSPTAASSISRPCSTWAGLQDHAQLTFGFDYQHIFYDEIDAISNSNDIDLTPCFGAVAEAVYCLGGKSGLGLRLEESGRLQGLGCAGIRATSWKFFGGVSYNTELLKSNQQALFNILTPATVRWHLTLGRHLRAQREDEFNLSFTYMPKETVDGTSPSDHADADRQFLHGAEGHRAQLEPPLLSGPSRRHGAGCGRTGQRGACLMVCGQRSPASGAPHVCG
jgi:long-chain fatty acid transport protein